RPIRVVEPDEVVVAPDDEVGPAVAVDVADVDALRDLPVDALVEVVPDELEGRRPRRRGGSRRPGSAHHRSAKELRSPEPRGAGLSWRPFAQPGQLAGAIAVSWGRSSFPRALHVLGGA